MTDAEQPKKTSILQSLGPALIVAAVVLGPGSILTSSRVGCEYGYSMLWILAGAAALMAGATAISATLGQAFERTLCGELAARLGRPVAAFVGVILFLIVACFQSSNNLAVVASLEPVGGPTSTLGSAILLGVFNLAIIVVLLAARGLYKHVESLMKILVGVMVVGFAINLVFAQPSVSGILSGLIPQLPDGVGGGFLPTAVNSTVDGEATRTIIDPWLAVQGMIATTFSIAGAFYQAYLVREKGWSLSDLRKGLTDSVCGIAALGLASGMILTTSAAVLHGKVDAASLSSAGDVAKQLEPLLKGFATTLFSAGIFAGALSSFLINAMIGGTLLSDGFGWGHKIDTPTTKWATAVALLVGYLFAVGMNSGTVSKVDVIIFAQALTVLGSPVLAVTLLYLTRQLPREQRPGWATPVALIACAVSVLLAVRTAWRIWLQVSA